MARRSIITIYQKREDEDDLKRMLQDLKKRNHSENAYHGRSESEIAKMILRGPLKAEHERLCGDK
jgi:hypothetical protein